MFCSYKTVIFKLVKIASKYKITAFYGYNCHLLTDYHLFIKEMPWPKTVSYVQGVGTKLTVTKLNFLVRVSVDQLLGETFLHMLSHQYTFLEVLTLTLK